MPKLSAIIVILLVAGAPLVGFAQGRPSPEALRLCLAVVSITADRPHCPGNYCRCAGDGAA